MIRVISEEFEPVVMYLTSDPAMREVNDEDSLEFYRLTRDDDFINVPVDAIRLVMRELSVGDLKELKKGLKPMDLLGFSLHEELSRDMDLGSFNDIAANAFLISNASCLDEILDLKESTNKLQLKYISGLPEVDREAYLYHCEWMADFLKEVALYSIVELPFADENGEVFFPSDFAAIKALFKTLPKEVQNEIESIAHTLNPIAEYQLRAAIINGDIPNV